jgi:selenocysteine-specific elongation factor
MAQEFVERGAILNINVGILGHVDSGKTSLVKSLSTSLSTAALDKNPQSQQRGITLDLGFSAFTLPMPEHLISSTIHDYDSIQFTLVDCPGHASLIRTIIGGAQIIDMILLVIDANKGIQTQTAECIVIGEITTDNMIIVMNKIDMLPENEREVRIERMTKRIRKIFATTKFANVPIIHTAAAIGGEKVAATSASNGVATSGQSSKGKSNAVQSSGIDTLVDLIKRTVQLPVRNMDSPFYFAIDHCFPIKGHGTVLTGTVLSGSISLNQLIEIPHMQITRKVKSLQMFRKPVRIARQGDRVGICVTNLDPNTIERSIAAHPGSVPLLSSVICLVKKVRFFKGACKSNTKFHVSIGHTTIISTAVFFGAAELSEIIAGNTAMEAINDSPTTNNSTSKQPTNSKLIPANKQSALNATYQHNFPSVDFDFSSDCQFQAEMAGAEEGSVQYGAEPVQWVLLQFQQPVFCPIGSLVIGSRLDADTRETSNGGLGNSGAASQCRLAFYGPVRESLTEDEYDKVQDYFLCNFNVFYDLPMSRVRSASSAGKVRTARCSASRTCATGSPSR